VSSPSSSTNRNIDAAALDVQTALTIAQRRLPIEKEIPRAIVGGRVTCLRRRSSTLPLSTVNEYGDITIGQTISRLGVAQVNVTARKNSPSAYRPI
jgi:HAE1 family hydrophobic/amphiphilic exporter-1